ncbi:hypothetical protein [Silvanigrella sp.]|jgi:hypothetical protein|uniref:hypothetical protein n=1 Tax=Silvanigrella sp. TaxID=2024976 RepID=UPI0037C8B5C1
MKSVKKNVLASSILSVVTLIGVQFAFTGQTHASPNITESKKEAFGTSNASYLNICNMTSRLLSINVSQIDNYDWDGDSRPDHNFNNVIIAPKTCSQNREELNNNAVGAFFRMDLALSNASGIKYLWFRADQQDALKSNFVMKIYPLNGTDANFYTLLQSVSGNINTFTLVSSDN